MLLKVRYTDPHVFDGYPTVKYQPFDDDGAYDELRENKGGVIAMIVMGIFFLAVAELHIIDSYVSYHRGRGFMTGYGHHVHVYGRVNPHYSRAARANHQATSSHSGGRGCACACACACAGGGRAGCSQKDTYARVKDAKTVKEDTHE
jgi:hypothetical protein